MSGEFQIDGKTYRFNPMPAMTQFHVVRKFGPAMRDAQAAGSGTMLECFARMSDADADFVIAACLGCCHRQDGVGWAPVWNSVAKMPQYGDLNTPAMLEIASHVMRFSFESFGQGPRSA